MPLELRSLKIYKLSQVSWESGTVSDFALPKVIGHYLDFDDAASVRNNIMPLKGYNDEWCDENDYTITEIVVHV